MLASLILLRVGDAWRCVEFPRQKFLPLTASDPRRKSSEVPCWASIYHYGANAGTRRLQRPRSWSWERRVRIWFKK